jgi:HEAT repeat protein
VARAKKQDDRDTVNFLVRSQDVDGLERLLLAPDIKGLVSKIATDGLLEINTPVSLDALGNVLSRCETSIVEGIIGQLDKCEPKDTVRLLSDCLGNPVVFNRSAAVQALSKQDSANAIPHLLRATRDPAKSLARMASRIILRRVERSSGILGQLSEATVEGVLDLMDDRWAMELLSPSYPTNIRILAAYRLGKIGGDEASQSLASIASTDRTELADACWRALESCHSVSDFILLPLLVNRDPNIKARALTLYAKSLCGEATDLFTGLCVDEAKEVRLAALQALSEVAGEGAIPTLVIALDDVEDEVRVKAIDLLCREEESTPELVQAVRTQDGDIRRRALVTLANREVVTSDLIQPYIEFLYQGSSCTDLSQRDYLDSLAVTAKTLGKSQNFEAMLALTALARSVIRRMRRAAITGLMEYPPEDRGDALSSLIDSHDPDIVKNVAFGLHASKDERAILPLIRASIECRGKPMVKAKEFLKEYPKTNDVEFLIECLSSRWTAVKRFSAEQLKEIADDRSIPALLETSRDDDVEVQLAVFEAMGPFASNHMDVRERMLEAIGYGDISVRQAACESLGNARCKEAVPDLIRALHNFFLRPRASQALRMIGDRKGFLAIKRLEIRERLFKKRPDAQKA